MEEKSRTWEVITRRRPPWSERGERIGVYFLVTRAFNQRLFWMKSCFCPNFFKSSKQEFWYSILFFGGGRWRIIVLGFSYCSFRFCLICNWSWLADGMIIWLTTLGGSRGVSRSCSRLNLWDAGKVFKPRVGWNTLCWAPEETWPMKDSEHSYVSSVFILFYVWGLS